LPHPAEGAPEATQSEKPWDELNIEKAGWDVKEKRLNMPFFVDSEAGTCYRYSEILNTIPNSGMA
jgi:hypothetical protein